MMPSADIYAKGFSDCKKPLYRDRLPAQRLFHKIISKLHFLEKE